MPLQQEIDGIFARYGDVIYGFTGISWSPFAQDYRSALVFAVPYGKQLTPETYTEPDFEEGIRSARIRLEEIVAQLEALLRDRRIAYYVPPVAQKNETELLAPFSFKTAAAKAGIGWFGKNDVIITRRYGPRVRLSALLIDAPFEYARPVTESRCPDDCVRCVEICPCKAIRGVQWHTDMRREEMIDYHRCNRMRSAFIPKLGRKNACGLCMAACPVGTDPLFDSELKD